MSDERLKMVREWDSGPKENKRWHVLDSRGDAHLVMAHDFQAQGNFIIFYQQIGVVDVGQSLKAPVACFWQPCHVGLAEAEEIK